MVNDGIWGGEPKTELTPREVLVVAYQHLIVGTDQHKLAAQFNINQGRINEAIKVIKEACENHRLHHAARRGKKVKEVAA